MGFSKATAADVGKRIKEARRAKGRQLGLKLTVEKLSVLTRRALSRTQITNYETGRRLAGPDEAADLASALDVSPGYLLGFDDNMTAHEQAILLALRTHPQRTEIESHILDQPKPQLKTLERRLLGKSKHNGKARNVR